MRKEREACNEPGGLVREITKAVRTEHLSIPGNICNIALSSPHLRHPKQEFWGVGIMHPDFKMSLQLILIKALPYQPLL